MRFFLWCLILFLISLAGLLLTAWYLALRQQRQGHQPITIILSILTFLLMISLFWLAVNPPGLWFDGKVLQFNRFSLETQIIDPQADFLSKQYLIRKYIRLIENDLSPLLKDHPVLTSSDWQPALATQAKEKSLWAYHLTLWEETNDPHIHTITCNITPINRVSTASIPPTMSIEVEEASIRLDWFINTGMYDLDIQILKTIHNISQDFNW
jgi:hypothetical protein